MKHAATAMPIRDFVRRTGGVAFDPAVVLFCGFIAFPITFGLALTKSVLFLVPGLLFLIFGTSAVMKYATVVSRSLALGNPVPGAENAIFDYLGSGWAFAPWLALLMLNGIGLAVWQFLGNGALVVFLILTLPLVPAAIAVISVNRSPLSMFRVASLLRVVRVLGSDYIKILFGWLLIALLGVWLRSNGAVAMSYLAVFVGCLQVMYLFSSTGVVLFHHHRALEIPIERDTREVRTAERETAAQMKLRGAALDQSYVFFSRGNSIGGLHRLKQYFAEHAADEAAWSWFIGEMREWENPQAALMLSRNYLSRLLQRDDKSEAFGLLVACIDADSSFAPHPQDRAAARILLAGHRHENLIDRWR